MNTNQVFNGTDDLAAKARAFVEAAGVFIGELAKTGDGLEVAVASLDQSDPTNVDYDAPVLDAYKKQYTPITASDIATANKQMSEAIAGEHWIGGFLTAVQLFMLFAK